MTTPGLTAALSLYVGSAHYRTVVSLADLTCGGLGQPCCKPRFPYDPNVAGIMVRCNQGLGCDIQTGKCVSDCGRPGRPCCDGPETRAPKWTADGKFYSPNSWNMKEMCDSGACDRQSHRCFACGTQDGAPCCPPDAAQATARCIGPYLKCEYAPGGFYESGICRACGTAGKPPCNWGCDEGLDVLNGLCGQCGGMYQPPCDDGCGKNLIPLNGQCRPCSDAGLAACNQGCCGAGQMCCNNKCCEAGWSCTSDGCCPPGVCCQNTPCPPGRNCCGGKVCCAEGEECRLFEGTSDFACFGPDVIEG